MRTAEQEMYLCGWVDKYGQIMHRAPVEVEYKDMIYVSFG